MAQPFNVNNFFATPNAPESLSPVARAVPSINRPFSGTPAAGVPQAPTLPYSHLPIHSMDQQGIMERWRPIQTVPLLHYSSQFGVGVHQPMPFQGYPPTVMATARLQGHGGVYNLGAQAPLYQCQGRVPLPQVLYFIPRYRLVRVRCMVPIVRSAIGTSVRRTPPLTPSRQRYQLSGTHAAHHVNPALDRQAPASSATNIPIQFNIKAEPEEVKYTPQHAQPPNAAPHFVIDPDIPPRVLERVQGDARYWKDVSDATDVVSVHIVNAGPAEDEHGRQTGWKVRTAVYGSDNAPKRRRNYYVCCAPSASTCRKMYSTSNGFRRHRHIA